MLRTICESAQYAKCSARFGSIAIYSLSWNLTTWCLAVTCSGSVGECGRLSKPSCTYLPACYLYFVQSFRHFLAISFNLQNRICNSFEALCRFEQ